MWICMAFCQSESWVILCFYRWHGWNDGVRMLGDSLLTRILVFNTFPDKLWLWYLQSYNFKKYSVPCILMASQRIDQPSEKIDRKTNDNCEGNWREKKGWWIIMLQNPNNKSLKLTPLTCKKVACFPMLI